MHIQNKHMNTNTHIPTQSVSRSDTLTSKQTKFILQNPQYMHACTCTTTTPFLTEARVGMCIFYLKLCFKCKLYLK